MEPAEQPTNAATPASPQNKGVLAFVQSLKAAPKAAEATAPKPSDSTKGFSSQGPLYHHFAEFGWSAQQNNWLKISFIVHCALAGLIWLGAFLAFTRPNYLQVGAPTLEESAKTFYATDYSQVDASLAYDQMSYFAISTLGILHQIDFNSNTDVTLNLLKGLVKPDILEKNLKYSTRNRPVITKQKFVQSLIINRVRNPIPNPAEHTIALFVEGNFAIALQNENGDPVNRITPYRAKCILRDCPISSLNPFPFMIEELDEVSGSDAAKKWDADNAKFFSK